MELVRKNRVGVCSVPKKTDSYPIRLLVWYALICQRLVSELVRPRAPEHVSSLAANQTFAFAAESQPESRGVDHQLPYVASCACLRFRQNCSTKTQI